MESVRAGYDMLHYFVMILYFVLILLLGVFTCFAGIRLGLGLAGKWRKGMDLRFLLLIGGILFLHLGLYLLKVFVNA